MLHNSLFRRDLLRQMNAEPVIVARREVHRNVAPRPDAKSGDGDLALTGAWSIQTATNHPAEKLLVQDAADFLKRMNVRTLADSREAAPTLRFEVGSCERGFRCVVEPERIEVHAADAAALWAGWVHLENEMRAAGGAILKRGEIMRQPAWEVQIAPPSWGASYAVPDLTPEFVGDDTFRSLAHQGVDGMFIYGDWLLYAMGTRLPELDYPEAEKNIGMLKQAAVRAAAYGIKLYFVPVSPKLPTDHAVFKNHPGVRGALLQSGNIHCLCSTNDDALAFHAEVFGKIFREVPELGGLILIVGGESYYHCFMRASGAAIGRTNCRQCDGKVAEDVIANLLKVTADAAHQHAPNAQIAAWPYSAAAFWSPEPNQLRLIDRLPEKVALLSEIDKDQTLTKTMAGGRTYAKPIWDYSVEVVDPSDRIISQAVRCRGRGRDLFVKTETCHGIELLHFPYVPCITRSAERWQNLRALQPRGVLQRWGFVGMFDSAAERIGYQARWDPNFAPASAALSVARQLCGSAAEPVVAAWRAFSEAVQHIPTLTTGPYYVGPAFLGPCHPLKTWVGETPAAFRASLYYLTEVDATFTPPRPRSGDDLTLQSTAMLANPPGVDIIEAEFAAARDLARAGHEILQKVAIDTISAGDMAETREQQLIGEYLYRTLRTTVNVIRFLRMKESNGDVKALKEIARDERENTQAARTVYENAPWLNHKLRLDIGVPDSMGMIDEKLKLLDAYLL